MGVTFAENIDSRHELMRDVVFVVNNGARLSWLESQGSKRLELSGVFFVGGTRVCFFPFRMGASAYPFSAMDEGPKGSRLPFHKLKTNNAIARCRGSCACWCWGVVPPSTGRSSRTPISGSPQTRSGCMGGPQGDQS